MRPTRRQVVSWGLSALALSAAPWAARAAQAQREGGRARRPLRLLVLGGTGFLGPALVEAARARGHALTLFNRGRTNPHLFPDLEKLRGDRDGKLEALRGRRWDAVFDDSGYVPRVVRQSAELLAPAVRRYVFVSSISVYPETLARGADETAPVQRLADPATEDVPAHYGALKAACEEVVRAAVPRRAVVVRPTLIVGPGDPTGRFTYWPVRLARGGEVLAPGDGEDPVQLVDVRDLAAFMVRLVEDEATGTFNAAGPERTLTTAGMLEACRAGAGEGGEGGRARLTWVPWSFLERAEVQPWAELPAWVPRQVEGSAMATVSVARAVGAGLAFRPLPETARDTLAWWRGQPEERRPRLVGGLAPEKEAAVLERWRRERSG